MPRFFYTENDQLVIRDKSTDLASTFRTFSHFIFAPVNDKRKPTKNYTKQKQYYKKNPARAVDAFRDDRVALMAAQWTGDHSKLVRKIIGKITDDRNLIDLALKRLYAANDQKDEKGDTDYRNDEANQSSQNRCYA